MAQAKNPYIAGNPVGGSAAFVGRDDVLRAVKRVLGDPQHHGIVLYGQRRIGKTSILKHLAAWLPENAGARAIYFDLQDKASRPVGAILVDLAGKIAAALDLPDPEPAGDVEVWFRDTWLTPVLDGFPADESLVVLLDEFDVLADAESQKAASASFFGYLRELLEKAAPKLRLVFVIGRNLEELSYLVGPLFKALPREQVSLLTPVEAEAVMRLSEKNGSLWWSGDAIATVWELTNGHPYLLQHLCWQVWQRAHEGGQEQRGVSTADVEAAVPDTLKASENALEWLWSGLPPATKVVAAALAKAGGGVISPKTLEETLKESGVRVLIRELQDAPLLLSKWDIVEPVEGGQRFRVELLRTWIVKNKPLALVQQELDHIEPQAELLYKSGEGFYKSGDVDGALEQLQKATRINPNHRRANELLVEINISRGAWDEALYFLEKFAENYPAQAKPRLVQVLLAKAGSARTENRELNLYERVLKVDEDNVTAIEGRRAIWKSRGDRARDAKSYGEARDAYATAGLYELVEEVDRSISRDMLADTEEHVREFERTEQYAEALDEIHRANEQIVGLKDWAMEIARIETAREMEADYQRALGALKEGDKEAATALLGKIIGKRPKYKDAARLLDEVISGESIDRLRALRGRYGYAVLIALGLCVGAVMRVSHEWLASRLPEKAAMISTLPNTADAALSVSDPPALSPTLITTAPAGDNDPPTRLPTPVVTAPSVTQNTPPKPMVASPPHRIFEVENVAAPEVREFNLDAASRALGAASVAARGCKKGDGLTGTARVKVVFQPSGRVSSASVEPPFLGTFVGGCIDATFRACHVPAFDGSPVARTQSVPIN